MWFSFERNPKGSVITNISLKPFTLSLTLQILDIYAFMHALFRGLVNVHNHQYL